MWEVLPVSCLQYSPVKEMWCWGQQQLFCHCRGTIMRKLERLSQSSDIVELLNQAALEFFSSDFLGCKIMNVLTV